MKKNGGVVKSDQFGTELTRSQKSQSGVESDSNEWQVMNMQKFTDFMLKYEIIYSVVANLEPYTLVSIGWSYKLPYQGLLDLFHDEESLKSLNDSLKGEIMPQAMRQGELKCLLCKPKCDVLIGLFYIENRDVAEAYKFGRKINDELSQLINA